MTGPDGALKVDGCSDARAVVAGKAASMGDGAGWRED